MSLLLAAEEGFLCAGCGGKKKYISGVKRGCFDRKKRLGWFFFFYFLLAERGRHSPDTSTQKRSEANRSYVCSPGKYKTTFYIMLQQKLSGWKRY